MTITIYYWSSEGFKNFKSEAQNAIEKNPEYRYEIEKLIQIYRRSFRTFSEYHEVKISMFNIINYDGVGTYNSLLRIEKQFIYSDMDWILVVLFVIVLIIMLISFVDFYFYSKRPYDITITQLLR